MRTAQQWLDLPIDKLKVELAKAFDDPHKCEHRGSPCWLCSIGNCEGCEHYDITIDMNTAMEWLHKVIGDLGLAQLVVYSAIYHMPVMDTNENRWIAGTWFSSYLATPRRWFIVIALMVQENTKLAAAMAEKNEGMSAREIAKFQKGVLDLRWIPKMILLFALLFCGCAGAKYTDKDGNIFEYYRIGPQQIDGVLFVLPNGTEFLMESQKSELPKVEITATSITIGGKEVKP